MIPLNNNKGRRPVSNTIEKWYVDGSGYNGHESRYLVLKGDYVVFHNTIEKHTSNEMEYLAMLRALEECNEGAIIYTDSQLVEGHLTKNWAVNGPNLRPLWRKAKTLATRKNIKIQWIRREKNPAGKLLEKKKNYYLFEDKMQSIHAFTKDELVIGISSAMPNGRHAFLADFDTTAIGDVFQLLYNVKDELPLIYILESSKEKKYPSGNHPVHCMQSYHAISFPEKGLSFQKYVGLLEQTSVDPLFLKFTKKDKCGTLRITKKRKGQVPKLVAIIPSNNPENIDEKETYFKLLDFEDGSQQGASKGRLNEKS